MPMCCRTKIVVEKISAYLYAIKNGAQCILEADEEQVSHEITGLISADVSPGALVDVLRRMSDEPDLYERSSSGALETVATTLSWNKVAGQFAKVVENVGDFSVQGRF